MMRRTLQYLALAPAFALGAVLEQIAGPPTGWADVVSNTSVGGDVHAFTIALAMLNIGDLESRLLAVSTPGSPSYGKYLTKDEVDAAFAPSPTTVSIVTDWLKQNKVQNLSVSGALYRLHRRHQNGQPGLQRVVQVLQQRQRHQTTHHVLLHPRPHCGSRLPH